MGSPMSLNRQKLTLLLSSIVLLLGAIYPWYRLPQEALETFGANLFWVNAARIAIALLALVGLFFTFVLLIKNAPRLLFWSALISTLLFPYFVTTWSPRVAFIASAYYQQAEAVSTHVDQNFPQVQAQWKRNISLYQPEAPPSIFEMSIQDSRFFQMPSWDKVILNGFGYKNSFLSFIGKGWGFSLTGLLISLFGIYLGLQEQGLKIFIQDFKLLGSITILLFAIILISLVGVNLINYQLDTQFAKGEYQQVISVSNSLASWYPPLQGDEAFLERLARAELYTNKPEPALVSFIKGIERYNLGDFKEAENYFQESLNIQPHRFIARGYLVSAILNQGVSYLNKSNTRKSGSAADIFEKALQIFPGHVEALYDLMLARVVNGEFQKSADIAKQIIDQQQYFQEQKIGLLGQAYLHLTWAEYNNGNANKTWEKYRQSVDANTWNKSSVDESL